MKNTHSVGFAALEGDWYTVNGKGDRWTATVFQGINEIDLIHAISEKQAHFIAKDRYPGAKSPAEQDADYNKQYNSAEGKAYRNKQSQLLDR